MDRSCRAPRFFHMRTLELFRSAGIEDEVEREVARGVRARRLDRHDGHAVGKVLEEFVPSLNAGVDAFSPCRRLFVTQPGLEPILRRAREEHGRARAERA